MRDSGSYLSSAEATRRLGVTGKALRHYEALGLITSERTPAGWRVYGPTQITRLHHVLALKSFGFPLSRIAELLSGQLADLDGFFALHENVILREGERLQKARQLLAAARAKLSEHGTLTSDDLIDLTKETFMTENHQDEVAAAYMAIAAKHFSVDDQAALAARGYAGMHKADAGWDGLHEEAARLMATGDPASQDAMDLARRWMGKVFEATGGDPALTHKMKTVARETLEQPAFESASTSSVAMMDFVAKAYGAAIAAGLMPKPDAEL